jgi:hypothetical protein
MRGKETAVTCESCGESFVVAADDESIVRAIFGHEVECPYCFAWCEFTLDEDTFQPDD